MPRGPQEQLPHLRLARQRGEPLGERVDGLELRVQLLPSQGGAGALEGLGGEPGEAVEQARLAAGEGLDLEPIGDDRADDDVPGAHGHHEDRAHLDLPPVPGQLPEEPLEVGGVEGLASLHEEGEGVGAQGGGAAGQQRGRSSRHPQVRLLALAVDVEVEHAVRPHREVGHVHDPLQGQVELARAVELPGPSTLARHLPQGLGRARGRRGGAVRLLVELLDPVLEPGQLGEGRAEAALLARERAVDGEGEGDVRGRGGQGRLPVERRRACGRQRREERAHGLREREQGRLRGHAERHREALGDGQRGHEQGHERPHGEAARADHLAEGVHREHEEGLQGERLRQLAAAEAGQERRGRHAEAEQDRIRRLQPVGRPPAERPHEGDEGERPGQAEQHLAGAPTHADIQDRVGGGAGIDHGGGQRPRR